VVEAGAEAEALGPAQITGSIFVQAKDRLRYPFKEDRDKIPIYARSANNDRRARKETPAGKSRSIRIAGALAHSPRNAEHPRAN